MENKIIFIVPYYGKFPEFFREWAYTAGYLEEQNIDFLLVTDLNPSFKLPKNIHIKRLSFKELKKKIQACFAFEISLKQPYKLCDFKPAYGLVFQEEIKEYDFWGHCDVDQLWGDVRKFITDDILRDYDKVQYMGHFVLYRNCERMNNLFRLDGAIYDYRYVFSVPEFFSFDEHPGMMQIVAKHGISNYIKTIEADISPRYTRTFISRVKNYRYQILYWHNGCIFRKYIDENGNVSTDEFMYAHFQRKRPKSLEGWNEFFDPKAFIYYAEGFKSIDPEKIDKAFILDKADYINEKINKRENRIYKINKIKQFVTCSFLKKRIWLKQRKATKYLMKNKKYFSV